MKAFLLSYGVTLNVAFVHYVLNDTNAVKTWVSPLPNASILVSDLTVIDLSAVLHGRFGDAWFVLVEANADNCNGWLPNEFWEYLTNPSVAWSKQLFKKFIPANMPSSAAPPLYPPSQYPPLPPQNK